MYNREFPFKQGRTPSPALNPSFSSTLLDEIYRSIDGGEDRHGSFRGVGPSPIKDKFRENWAGGQALVSRMQGSGRCFLQELDTKPREFDIDHDATYFSSMSISSDSSYGGFSSSDSDSFHSARMLTSCFVPLKLRLVKTHAIPARKDKEGHGSSSSALSDGDREEGVVTKSRALKVFETPKKVRQQPVSAGGRLTSILNSIFASSSTKKKGRSKDDTSFERKSMSGEGQISTGSLATSFSRACRNSIFSSRSAAVSSREDLKGGTGTRSVRFSPVSVMVREDHPRRPYGWTFQHNEPERRNDFGSGRNRIAVKNLVELKKKWEEERTRVDKTKGLEDIIRRNQATPKVDDDDGAGSCSSSDLFEIDHLATIGNHRDDTKNQVHAVCKKLGM